MGWASSPLSSCRRVSSTLRCRVPILSGQLRYASRAGRDGAGGILVGVCVDFYFMQVEKTCNFLDTSQKDLRQWGQWGSKAAIYVMA